MNAPDAPVIDLDVPVPPAELLVSLKVARGLVAGWSVLGEHDRSVRHLDLLIDEVFRHRPVGDDGQHSPALCTPTCGCPNRHYGTSSPIGGGAADKAALRVTVAIRHALARGAFVDQILGAVANGVTGHINGYRERALRRFWHGVYLSVLEQPLEKLKADEAARHADQRALAAVEHSRPRPGGHR